MALRPLITGEHARWLLALVLAISITGVSFVHAAPDASCLQKASSDRSSMLKTAYDDYAKDMQRSADRLTTSESNALKIKDLGQQQSEMNRAQATYSTDTIQATQTLTYNVQRAWADYASRQGTCGYATASTYPYYGTQYSYGYPYDGSSIHGSAPWYGSSYYGGYYSGYYPYSYGYNNYQFDYGYSSYGQSYCPQVVLPTVSVGCGIEFSRDDRGCPKAEVSCHNIDTTNRPQCACPTYYSPVCGRDGRTYTNYCNAQCADTAIVYGGACQY